MLNVCAPSAEEQKEIASALARVPKQPLFGPISKCPEDGRP